MPTALHYRATLTRLADLASEHRPAHVRVEAASLLVRALSPNNPQHHIVQQMLREADAFELARHKLRDLYDRAIPLCPEPPLPELIQSDDAALALEEEAPDEAEDPL